MKNILLFVTCLIGLAACKNEKAATSNPASSIPTPQAPSVQAINAGLDPMPVDEYQDLKLNCDAVDYIFNELPFSINQTERASVLTNLTFISLDPAPAIPADCKPMGREFFQSKGEIIYEADFYYCPPVFAYVFYKDKKAIYASKMSNAGINFYTNLIKQITTQKSTN